jgi:hypothetical protein
LVRTLLALAVALCTTATLLSTSSDTAPQLELAADTNQFDPGNIISDAMFFDPNALTAGQIADFIAAKGAACQWGSDGSPCLKNFRQDTFTRAADGICDNAYWGAAGESAAMIIWKGRPGLQRQLEGSARAAAEGAGARHDHEPHRPAL